MSAVLDPTVGVDLAADAVQRALAAGADEAQVTHLYDEMFEITFDNHDVSMVRTTVNDQVTMTVFVGGARGQSSLTGRAPDLVDQAAREAVGAAQAGMPDPANGVTDGDSLPLTELGHRTPDKAAMLDTVTRHQEFMAEHHPNVLMRDSTYQFSSTWRSFANSAGRHHQERRGGYSGTTIFSGKDGERTTSFNYTAITAVEPIVDLIEMGSLRRLLDEIEASLDPKAVPSTFVGDLIFTPDSLADLIDPILQSITGYALMKGTSPFKDAIGNAIASPLLTVANRPLSAEFPLAKTFDGDGVPAHDLPIITDGVLEHHLIDWYTSRKLGRPMTAGTANIAVAAGTQTFDELVAGTERGIILGRFSGGIPNQKLDFSGVAKNSFYVEDGAVQFAIHETMVAGNLADLLTSIRAVGSETVNFGDNAYPALATSGATISTK